MLRSPFFSNGAMGKCAACQKVKVVGFNKVMEEKVMVEMYEICEGMFVPKECCTFKEPLRSGGEMVADDTGLPCGDGCSGVCEGCIVQEVFNDYASLTGQAGAGQEGAKGNAAGPGLYVKVRMKGHKKIRKRIRRMKREARKLNKEMERAVELGKDMDRIRERQRFIFGDAVALGDDTRLL